MGRSAKPFYVGSIPILHSNKYCMKKLVFVTTILAFGAGLIVGWSFLPQPQWLFDAFGHYLLPK